MKLLGIDFETQSDKAADTNMTEIGAVLMDVQIDVGFQKLGQYSTLVYHPSYPPQTEQIVELTGITDEMLKSDGREPVLALQDLLPWYEQADLIVAHNINFDRTVFLSQCLKYGLYASEKEWLCTLTEVPYPPKYTCKKLSHLAFDHGVKVDHRDLHRAVDDVELMFDLLSQYNLGKVLTYSRTPWVYLKADILPPWKDNSRGKDEAQKLGFSWERAKHDTIEFPKTWVKRVKADQVEKVRESATFRVGILK